MDGLRLAEQEAHWLQVPHGVLLVLWAVALAGWLVAHPAARRPARGLLVAALGWMVLVLFVVGPQLPVAAFQPLREGFTEAYLEHATGHTLDVGRVPALVWRWWFRWLQGPPPSLRDAVTSGLVVSGWVGLLLLGWAWARLGRGWQGPVVVLGAMGSAGWAVAALGPLYPAYVGLYVLVGAMLLVAGRDGAVPVWGRAAAHGGLVGTGVMLLGVRDEMMAVVAAGSLAWVLGRVAPRVEQVWEGRARRAQAWLVPRWWLVPVALAAWVGLAAVAYDGSLPPMWLERWRWLVAVLHPMHVHGLTLPIYLLALVPVGIVLLALRGAWEGTARPVTFAALPWLVLVLFMTARIAAHGRITVTGKQQVAPFEIYRYLQLLLPMVFLLALEGARVVSHQTRSWLAVACLVPAVPWVSHGLDLQGGPEVGWPLWGGVQTQAQVEVRTLAARLEAEPTCGVITRAFVWGRPVRADTMVWVAARPDPNGPGFRTVRSDLPANAPVQQVADALLGGVPCAVAYRSLDCHDAQADCATLDGLDVLEELAAPDEAFVHPQHGSQVVGPVVLGWLAVPGWAPSGR